MSGLTTKDLVIRGAKENNLKNLSVTIPRDKMVVFTGISGSGKSSLAFDTIYGEGQRRYIESLSSYARQFLGQMKKPDVEAVEGLSPAISIDQKTTSKNPRSTVGTVTEIYDYLRLLYARIGEPHCPLCGRVIASQTVDQIVDAIMEYPEGTRLMILAPVVRDKKGQHERILARIRREGFTRVRVDGELRQLDEEDIKLEKTFKHTIDIVVDRLIVRKEQEAAESLRGRLTEACELAVDQGDGILICHVGEEDRLFSTKLACPDHGVSIEEMEPRTFSFNNPHGACATCKGLGFVETIDPQLVVVDENKSIIEGAIGSTYGAMKIPGFYRQQMEALAASHHTSLEVPYKEMPESFKEDMLFGTGDRPLVYEYHSRHRGTSSLMERPFEGVVPSLQRRYAEADSDFTREKLHKLMTMQECPSCHGNRLKPEVLAVTVHGQNIKEACDLSVEEALAFIENMQLSPKEEHIARPIIRETYARLKFLKDVGLDYLTLSRSAATLSGGESQRIRLATQIGSGLVGVLYILDEPSIGLHQRDNAKLLESLRSLTDMGNTLIVVEHDEDTMYAADHIVDIGPGAGVHGGYLVAQGTVEDIKNNPDSITGQYLSGKKSIAVPQERRAGNGLALEILGAEENNLKKVDVQIPLGKFVCVTGVSGSGKSTLVNDILYEGLAAKINGAKTHPGKHVAIQGVEHIDKVIDINQSPIGRTPRSNPATYIGVFDHIRNLFAETPEAKIRGYQKGRFSFNVKGGRCESCSGDGIIKVEMHFLPDIYVPCDVCKGKRFNRETLEVKYKGKSIFDVLDMNVEEATDFFKNQPRIHRYIQTLQDVGLGYVKLGQPSTELSGGEAQRIKLATELAKRSTGRTLYILDEPTTGLHMADVDNLLQVLDKLVDEGNTVVVIEHNLDVIKRADHIIDLGPEGGFRGGQVVATGTPEEVAEEPNSYTGQYLKKMLKNHRAAKS